jgi:hypothetical protein
LLEGLRARYSGSGEQGTQHGDGTQTSSNAERHGCPYACGRPWRRASRTREFLQFLLRSTYRGVGRQTEADDRREREAKKAGWRSAGAVDKRDENKLLRRE